MLSIEELRKLAELARIRVPDEELEGLRGQLDEILKFVGQVQACLVEPEGEVGMRDQLRLRNVFREDGAPHEAGKFTEDIMRNVPFKERGYVRVKKILEK